MPESDAMILPTDVRPTRYALTLAPDLSDFTFRGEESIEIEILKPTSAIALNSAELAIQSCALTLSDGTRLIPTETSLNEEDETAVFQFESELPAGPATLALDFTGELNDKLRGFYRSKYTGEDGEGDKYLATTQFEATDARRAFPCWDEPALKAAFKVTLLVPSDLAALSNMPVASESTDQSGLKRVEFAETPIMSTYLLVFVVGDLKAIGRRSPDGTLVRIWAPAGGEERGRFALDLSVRLLEYLNDYFGIPYPLEKLDHLAIPDFAAGAMENWGAITYRETAILVDPDSSSARTRQNVATIVAHEMAHMWFGDLVTMRWWNDLWLNESFASWLAVKAVDHLFPDWEMWTQFVSYVTNEALELDGLKNSHPIEQEVNNPAEIGQLFDAISYNKGGAVLRMLEQFLGADIFRDGLRRYIAKHEYGNARTRDLWDALGEASGQPVAAMMDTWVNQTGYPVVDVLTSPSGDGVDLTASQTRFLYERVVDPELADDTLWHLPLSARKASGLQPASQLMDGRQATMRLPHATGERADGWIKVNPEQTGFYRVNYSSDDWANLRPAVEGQVLPAADRLGLQSDAYALSRAGLLTVTQFLALAEAYVNETDATVWADLGANLSNLDTLLGDAAYYANFQSFARRIFQPIGRKVGWVARPEEGHLDALLRTTVLAELGNYGDEGTLTKARNLFDDYVEEPDRVHPDIRGVVFSLAAKRGDRSVYDTMWELQKNAALEEERVRFLRALTYFEEAGLLEETLRRSLTTDVRVHNTVAMVVSVASNRHGRDLAWEFVKTNWEEFDRRYGEGGFALMRLVAFTENFSTQEMAEDVQRFFADNPAPAAERTVRQSLETIRLNIAWLEKNRVALEDRFGG